MVELEGHTLVDGTVDLDVNVVPNTVNLPTSGEKKWTNLKIGMAFLKERKMKCEIIKNQSGK